VSVHRSSPSCQRFFKTYDSFRVNHRVTLDNPLIESEL